MRQYLILLFIAFAIHAQGQTPYYGVDSAKNIRWSNDIFTTFEDSSGNYNEPCDYIRTEYDLRQSDGISVMLCGKKKLIYSGGSMSVPKQFIYKIKTPEDMIIRQGSKIKGENIPVRPDSVTQIDYAGLDQFYIDKRDSLKLDTLQVSEWKVFGFNEFSNNLYRTFVCSYKYNLKDGDERGYYKISELKDVCVTDNFLLKYEGKWKAGEKHGDWKEYDKSGKLISIKKYKHGQLIKQKDF